MVVQHSVRITLSEAYIAKDLEEEVEYHRAIDRVMQDIEEYAMGRIKTFLDKSAIVNVTMKKETLG